MNPNVKRIIDGLDARMNGYGYSSGQKSYGMIQVDGAPVMVEISPNGTVTPVSSPGITPFGTSQVDNYPNIVPILPNKTNYSINPLIANAGAGNNSFMVNIVCTKTGTGSGNTKNPIFLFGSDAFSNMSKAYSSVLNAGQIVEKSRYSKSMVIKPSVVIESEGVQEALEDYGFTEDNAKRVVTEIMMNPEADAGENPLSSFRIEVSADSLVQMDEQQEKMDRMEFLKAAGSFIKDALPVIQSSPQSAPLMVQMLKFGVTGFKVGKTIEGDFDQALDQLKQQAAQPQQPKPDPEMAKVEAKKAADAANLQADKEKEQARAQADAFIENQRMAAEERQAEREATLRQNEMAMEHRFKQQEAVMEQAFARFLINYRCFYWFLRCSLNACF